MPRTSKKPLKELDPVTQRLNQVRNEFNKSQPYKQKAVLYFAKALKISSTNCYRFLYGEADPNKAAIDGVVALGYSSEWFLIGTGEKKPKERTKTAFHDLKALLTEVDKMRNEMNAMRIRMRLYEEENTELKKELAEVKKLNRSIR